MLNHDIGGMMVEYRGSDGCNMQAVGALASSNRCASVIRERFGMLRCAVSWCWLSVHLSVREDRETVIASCPGLEKVLFAVLAISNSGRYF